MDYDTKDEMKAAQVATTPDEGTRCEARGSSGGYYGQCSESAKGFALGTSYRYTEGKALCGRHLAAERKLYFNDKERRAEREARQNSDQRAQYRASKLNEALPEGISVYPHTTYRGHQTGSVVISASDLAKLIGLNLD